MTEHINDQISAFIDDELSDEESAFLLRRFERDPQARNRALRYTLIGSALRGELVADPDMLRRRVAAALTGAPPAPLRVPARARASYWRPAVGIGIAASVAAAALLVLRSLNDNEFGLDAAPAALTAGASAVQEPDPASYVVPPEVSQTPAVQSPIRLTNYLMHHGEYASGLNRTSVNSNVVGAGEHVEPLVVERVVGGDDPE